MPVTATSVTVTQLEADAIVVGIYADSSPAGAAAELDKATGGLLSRLIERKEITGKKNELTTILGPAGVKAHTAVVVGLGSKDSFDRGVAFRAAATASKHLAGKERGKVGYYLADDWTGEQAESGVAGSIVGCVGQDLYKAKKKHFPPAKISGAASTKRLWPAAPS